MSISSEDSMDAMWETSQMSAGNIAYLEEIYEKYLEDPDSVESDWKAYFDSIRGEAKEELHSQVRKDFVELVKNSKSINRQNVEINGNFPDGGDKVSAVMDLVYAYRYVGHKMADIDPLGLIDIEKATELDLSFHGLTEADMSEKFNVGIFSAHTSEVLSSIVNRLKSIYCGTIGAEYMHLSNMEEKLWIRNRLESKQNQISSEKKKWLLQRLTAAEGLEKYLGMKYVGQKRFSVEGAESLIISLNSIIENGGSSGVKNITIGMAHRGRLNVLVNIMGKSPESLFREFEGSQDKVLLSGDVKYHMGFSSYHRTSKGDVSLSLAFNPSHLETVDAVVEGSARARQDRRGVAGKDQVVPIQIHGDSAFCGQGVVMETLALSQTRYFGTGGTVHIVINNQVGFTTSKKEDNRSSLYCTDIAKMIECPIFHVNADDPEAVFKVSEIAMDYRMRFNKDVVIDLVCYRRHGHQEVDEPTGTQPHMYSVIKSLKSSKNIYADKLILESIVESSEVSQMAKDYRSKLDKGEVVAGTINISHSEHQDSLLVNWEPHLNKVWDERVSTKYSKDVLLELGKKLCEVPKGFILQPQVEKAYSDRRKMLNGDLAYNWGFAELLAYASLLKDGFSLRLSGEDSGRGTFSHRHAVLHNYDVSSKELTEYTPIKQINGDINCDVIDSVLSEYGVLGFEYGYSCASPKSLVIWEAQFGDFANTAQVVIDQFIASAEEKWGRLCGLVMFLPHGQEGQGAEHSSARLERYLQLCANDNMQVCNVTTPAQLFHMLRRQMIRPLRKPLIVMSPKSLLRHPMVTSTIDEMSDGSFKCVLGESDSKLDLSKTDRLIICSGKVYYDLLAKRVEHNINNIAIIRLEQLYPFPVEEIQAILLPYKHIKDIVWTQEEPENQGAWRMIQHEIRKVLGKNQELSYAGRKASSAPAVGYPSLFHEQQVNLVNEALKLSKNIK